MMKWKKELLFDLVESFHQGLNTAGEKIKFTDVGFPIIQTRNVENGLIDLHDKIKFISQADWEKYKDKYRPAIGDVFFTNIGTIGKTAVVSKEDDYLIHWNIFKIRPLKNKIDSAYLKSYLDYLTNVGYFSNSQKGGTVNFVTKKMMGDVEIPAPPLEEQKRIVAILDQAFAYIDRARALAEKNLKNARELFDSYLQQVFSKRGEGWQNCSLSEICTINPPKSEARKVLSDDNLVSFVPMNCLGIDRMDLDLIEARQLKDVSGSYTYFADNDVLLAKITPCFENGKLGLASNLVNGIGFGSSEFIVFRCHDGLNPKFLYYYLSRKSFLEEGKMRMAGAVGHRRVTKEFIENYPIWFPSIEQQARNIQKIDSFRRDVAYLFEKYTKKIILMEELKKSILHKAFNGELTKSKGIAA